MTAAAGAASEAAEAAQQALFTNDAVVLGILMAILGFVFYTSSSDKPGWKKFYGIVPSLFVIYFLPSLFTTARIIPSEGSQIYFVASRYLLPTSLVLLTLSIDLKGILRLGPKAIVMFLTGTLGIVIGGPIAILTMTAINPDFGVDTEPVEVAIVRQVAEPVSLPQADDPGVGAPENGDPEDGDPEADEAAQGGTATPEEPSSAGTEETPDAGAGEVGEPAVEAPTPATEAAPDVDTEEPAQSNLEKVWRGMTTVAGSWIGGGANQAAMKEVFEVDDKIFSAMVAVDIIVANVWMAFLLICAGRSKEIDAWNGADASAIEDLRERVSTYQASIARLPKLADTMLILAVGFTITAVAHAGADVVAPAIEEHLPALERFSLTSKFFWLVVFATTMGICISFFEKARELEGIGASRLGSVLLYVLVASIGMKMDLWAIVENPSYFLLGGIWMAVHAVLLLTVAKLIRAPVFFMAVGSQANVGGAASAPIVASAFHPALAPVGVLLAVFGYALGTYAAWFCGQLMRVVAGG
jgi:uncharacterized membrane protein